MNSMMKKSLLASSVALAVCSPVANAALVTNIYGAYTWSTDRANFTALDSNGYILGQGGTNDVAMTWDGNAYNSGSDYTGPGGPSNVTMSSTTAFYGYIWTAHDAQVFTPGSYSFDTSLGGGNPESGMMNVTVGAGQLGMHMLFDWSGMNNIDVFVVWVQNQVFGSGVGTNRGQTPPCSATTKNCLWTGSSWVGGLSTNAPTGNQTWMLASTDGNGDGIMGVPMAAGGPFAGFNFNFNANVVATPKASPIPLPAAVWLFGSGLTGLFGLFRVARRNYIRQHGPSSG